MNHLPPPTDPRNRQRAPSLWPDLGTEPHRIVSSGEHPVVPSGIELGTEAGPTGDGVLAGPATEVQPALAWGDQQDGHRIVLEGQSSFTPELAGPEMSLPWFEAPAWRLTAAFLVGAIALTGVAAGARIATRSVTAGAGTGADVLDIESTSQLAFGASDSNGGNASTRPTISFSALGGPSSTRSGPRRTGARAAVPAGPTTSTVEVSGLDITSSSSIESPHGLAGSAGDEPDDPEASTTSELDGTTVSGDDPSSTTVDGVSTTLDRSTTTRPSTSTTERTTTTRSTTIRPTTTRRPTTTTRPTTTRRSTTTTRPTTSRPTTTTRPTTTASTTVTTEESTTTETTETTTTETTETTVSTTSTTVETSTTETTGTTSTSSGGSEGEGGGEDPGDGVGEGGAGAPDGASNTVE